MTANPERPEVEIALGPQTFTVRPTLDLVARLEQRLGGGLAPFIERLESGKWSATEVLAVIQEALAKTDGAPNAEEIGERVMDDGFVPHRMHALVLAYACLTGRVSRAPKPKADAPKPGEGGAQAGSTGAA